MPSMTKRSRKMLILFLALVILLSFFSSCRIGNAPKACDVLSEMLAAAKGLPVGSFYSSKSEKGASNYLSESLMTALYGTDSFPEVFARAEEIAVWLSSGIYACEFAVFLCSNRRDAEEISDLCLGRIDTMRHFINANSERLSLDPSGSENLKNAKVKVVGQYVIMAVWKDADISINAAKELIS